MLSLMGLQVRYAERHPGAQIVGPEIYGGPMFAGGRNIFCAVDPQGALLAYGALYPQLAEGTADAPHQFWFTVKVDPERAEHCQSLEDQLYERLMGRAREALHASQSHGTALMSLECVDDETPVSAFVERHRFYQAFGACRLVRDLTQPLPEQPDLPGVSITTWTMEDVAEQLVYLRAKNACFPEAPWTMDELQHFLGCVVWKSGAPVAALVDGQLVGSVLAYRAPDDAPGPDAGLGYTEEVFVLPGYRGRGMARAMLAYALGILKQKGAECATLEVRLDNERALSLYEGLGYVKAQTGLVYSREIKRDSSCAGV